MRSFAGVLTALLVLAAAAQAGQTIVRVYVRDYEELSRHVQFKGTSINVAGKQAGESYDLILDRADLARLLGCGLRAEVIVDDTDTRKLEAEQFGYYCSYDSLVRIMRNWAANYPNICRFDSIGRTHEGRWVYGVKISDNPQVEEDEPEVLLEALHHAREWATPQSARHFGDTLLRNYATNPTFQSFINNHQLWIFPAVNVDGYAYDYPSQRSWRKNRQPFSTAIGCDPNRDYGGACSGYRMDDWGALVSGSQSSHMPSSEVFMGGYAAWGREVDALATFFRQHTFVCDISLHSYSELVLWPFGSGSTAPDNATLVSLGQRMAAQMNRLSGGTYTPQQSNYLYPTSGGSCDWMYGWGKYIGGFPCMSYVFELGTTFYQNTGQLDNIQTQCFKGAWYLFQRADSIRTALKGFVPRPILARLDSSATGDFRIHWTPIRPAYNQPDKWELEELSGLTVVEDDFEGGTGNWTLQGASASTTQKHSGTYSVSLGTGHNISNYMVTNDPYPVNAGDSLKFWIWYNTENNYDVVVAEVSREGKEWFQLHERFTGNSSGWMRRAYPLEPWAGRSLFIRFRYMTDDNTLGTGVYIDDVWPVPEFANRTTISSNILDTLYEVTGKQPGRYWYRVAGHNSLGWSDKGPLEDIVVTGSAVAAQPGTGFSTRLVRVGPSPARGHAAIGYQLGRAGAVRLEVVDASGRRVRTLENGNRQPGGYAAVWDGRDELGRKAPAGVYYCRLSADRTLTARLVRVE